MKKEKYIKEIISIDYTTGYDVSEKFVVYARPGEKYKVRGLWGNYRERATETLWIKKDTIRPWDFEIYTEKDLLENYKVLVNGDGTLWKMACVTVNFQDGDYEIAWYKTNEEAEQIIADRTNEYGLKKWKNI